MGKKKSVAVEELPVDAVAEEPRKKKVKKVKRNEGESAVASNEENSVKSKPESENAHGEENFIKKKKKKKNKKQEAEAGANDAENANENQDMNPKVELGVIVSGRDSSKPEFKPVTSFADLQVPKRVLECCSKFAKPSPIQSFSWPFLLAGRNLIGIARTGSGKTLAFGIPAVMHVLSKKQAKATHCLVLSPTRELAQQITDVLAEAGASSGVNVVCLYGGAPKGHQRNLLKNNPAIIVATPGRLLDFINDGDCHLERVTYMVLDEADRMLDMGFMPDVRKIISHVSEKRQNLMFSATWPEAVGKLAKEFIQDTDPVKVTIGSEDLAANHDVTQIVEVIDERAKDARLLELVQQYHKSRRNRVLVFVLYKPEAERVAKMLQRNGWSPKALSGDKSQSSREEAIKGFKDGSFPLLVATDVCARGLDIPDVEYVINYTFPLTAEDYVHRIGRTGRAGKKGTAHTLFTVHERSRAGELVNILREAGQTIPESLLKFGTHVKRKESALYGAHFREISADAPKAKKIKFDSDDE